MLFWEIENVEGAFSDKVISDNNETLQEYTIKTNKDKITNWEEFFRQTSDEANRNSGEG